jgi:hypothetical protein
MATSQVTSEIDQVFKYSLHGKITDNGNPGAVVQLEDVEGTADLAGALEVACDGVWSRL